MGEFHKLELEPHRLQTAASEPTAEVRYTQEEKGSSRPKAPSIANRS